MAPLLSSIKELRQASPDGPQRYVISLANGQVWRQVNASGAAPFMRVGDDVRIEKATLGAYHLFTTSTGSTTWLQVIRIQ